MPHRHHLPFQDDDDDDASFVVSHTFTLYPDLLIANDFEKQLTGTECRL